MYLGTCFGEMCWFSGKRKYYRMVIIIMSRELDYLLVVGDIDEYMLKLFDQRIWNIGNVF